MSNNRPFCARCIDFDTQANLFEALETREIRVDPSNVVFNFGAVGIFKATRVVHVVNQSMRRYYSFQGNLHENILVRGDSNTARGCFRQSRVPGSPINTVIWRDPPTGPVRLAS
jgi:hypothetical protein